jgi:hypothetical protein
VFRRPSLAIALLVVAAAAVAFAALVAFPRPSAPTADAGSSASLAIDADPTNGTAPCDPVDATRTVDFDELFSEGCASSTRMRVPSTGLSLSSRTWE